MKIQANEYRIFVRISALSNSSSGRKHDLATRAAHKNFVGFLEVAHRKLVRHQRIKIQFACFEQAARLIPRLPQPPSDDPTHNRALEDDVFVQIKGERPWRQ